MSAPPITSPGELLLDQFVDHPAVSNQRVMRLVERVNLLEKKTSEMVEVEPSVTKGVMAYVSQPVIFAQGDVDAKETTWQNGAEDLYIEALTYECYIEGPQRVAPIGAQGSAPPPYGAEPGPFIVDEGNPSGPLVVAAVTFSYPTPGAPVAARAAGSFITDGFRVGLQIRIQGTTNNNQIFIVSSVTALVLGLTPAEGRPVVAEGPLAVTFFLYNVLATKPGVLVLPTTQITPVSVVMSDLQQDPRCAEFDFMWNFRVDNRAYQFLPNGGGNGGYLPRTTLGYPERGEILRFKRPLRIPSSATLTFMCLPTLWGPAIDDFTDDRSQQVTLGNSQDRTVVNFVGIAWRTGKKLWPRR